MLKKLLNKTRFKFNCRERIYQSIKKIKYNASRSLFSCNKLMCSCKSEAHEANYSNHKLSEDIHRKILVLQYIYMLFASWEVRMVKNCDRGLENTARGRRPRAAFSRPRSQFFTIRTSQPANNIYILTG